MNQIRRGTGKPLLLIHGLGGSWRSWRPVLEELSAERQVIAVDLPGFGKTPPLEGDVTIASLADAVTEWLEQHELADIDMVGSSMGARLVLELSRRGVGGATVALNPGGFWRGWERTFFAKSIGLSVNVIRFLQPVMPFLTATSVGRTLLFSQFSPRPWDLSPTVTLEEMRGYATSPSLDELLDSLVNGPDQEGAAEGSTGPITIGWGRSDRVCFPVQAQRALAKFPGAQLHWFDGCGHYPHWDVPHETAQLILHATDELYIDTTEQQTAEMTSEGAPEPLVPVSAR